MVYVSNGQVLDSRSQSPWGLSLLVDLFWGAVEFIGLFFKTMIHPDLTKDGKSGSSSFTDGRGSPWRQEADGKNKPWWRSQCSTNGWRRMRKVNAYTSSVGAGLGLFVC
ncbi:putative selenoprotein K [Scophthalmus maximus]|uniref:Selenoprotein K n=2 Tax=Scophthalmus maximus TaxID=52904 RepID=A0A2U9BYP1_SCOMX|nr:putative selenoprotein K [Scophthalmus maximus]